MDQQLLASIVDQVVKKLRTEGDAPKAESCGCSGAAAAVASPLPATPSPALGVFERMEDAIKAGAKASAEYREFSIGQREKLISAIRRTGHAYKTKWAPDTVAETKMGRVDHKVVKFNSVCDGTRGTEDLTTWAKSGDRGLTIEEMAPFGLVAAVTPSTHPVPTLINNGISLLAGGNTAVFNPHPASKRVFAEAVATLNRELMAAGAPACLLTTVVEPTLESANEMFLHAETRLILVTGGPGVVKAALNVPKKAICAGPGNPPVVVDETADLKRAARAIVDGGGFDNNILCIGEKEVFCVDSVFDQLMREMEAIGCHRLSERESDALAQKAFQPQKGGHFVTSRDLVGRNASVLAETIGIKGLGANVPLLFGEVASASNLWVQEEQLMPFMPFVRVRNVDEAIRLSLEAEHGYRHTAVMHSRNVDNLSRFARACDCSIFVKNGPSIAGLAVGGEGYISYSIASPTGEGITTARTFTRKRRCTMVDSFRIV
ncbi:aldehyde dehydrogenase family protein [bacterium]|nr:aldehyde dehydrogenase family protein [bacterium]